MGRRSKARECALQMLYQSSATGDSMDRVVAAFWRVRSGMPVMKEMAERLARGATAQRPGIDLALAACLEHWRLDRLAAVDREILRLAAFELMHEPGTPGKVVLDEAVELAKRFGESDSAAFVNGVLDALWRRLRPDEAGRTGEPAPALPAGSA
jgi:N utilization substance protein B